MKKKIYTAPALSVEEFEMNEVICTSPFPVNSVDSGDLFNGTPQPGTGQGGSAPQAKGRGIWDED